MRIGAIFPQAEISPDPGAVREFAQAAEGLGYSHLFIADHVLGADPQHHPYFASSSYTHQSVMHEPFALMGYLAAITQRIGLCTGILILPQRQTALVAKQAAEVDVLSGGRLRLGVGIGWNHVEYEALGEDFHNRGRRSEEQIEVMRALWSQEVVDFRGRWHRIDNAGLNPLPVQRPIPVWLGAGGSAGPVPPERALRRVARIADGWFPFITPDQRGQEVLGRLREYIKEAGRDPSAVGIEPRIRIANRPPEEWLKELKAWEAMGASSVTMEARQGRLPRPAAEHIEALHQFKEVVGW